MPTTKEKLILGKLKNLQNVATLTKEYFMPFDEFMEKKHYKLNEAINAKDALHLYLNRYAAFMIETTARSIENIINGIEE